MQYRQRAWLFPTQSKGCVWGTGVWKGWRRQRRPWWKADAAHVRRAELLCHRERCQPPEDTDYHGYRIVYYGGSSEVVC